MTAAYFLSAVQPDAQAQSHAGTNLDGLIAHMPDALWRASQTAFHRRAALPSGFAELDQELPQGGWPDAVMVELLVQQAGIGEMRLLRPALQTLARTRRIVMVQPPHAPQIAAWRNWDLPPERLLWVKPESTADALWSAEQILKNGSCGALLLWQTQMRNESLRRLHLAAQDTDMLFWMVRPLAAAQDSSPSPLRLALRPAQQGVTVEFVKRRGAMHAGPLILPLQDPAVPVFAQSTHSTYTAVSEPDHAILDQSSSSAARARGVPAALV